MLLYLPLSKLSRIIIVNNFILASRCRQWQTPPWWECGVIINSALFIRPHAQQWYNPCSCRLFIGHHESRHFSWVSFHFHCSDVYGPHLLPKLHWIELFCAIFTDSEAISTPPNPQLVLLTSSIINWRLFFHYIHFKLPLVSVGFSVITWIIFFTNIHWIRRTKFVINPEYFFRAAFRSELCVLIEV